MNLEKRLEKVFRLNADNWMKHSNPMSVWTRYSVLPIIIGSVWSRVWLGWWCLVPVLISIVWMFINPVFFDKPKSTKNWASKAVLGERVYLNRDSVEIPQHHKTPLYMILNLVSMSGLLLAIWGVVELSVWAAIAGTGVTILGKSWFLDRMVWLYEDMKDNNDTYRSWDY